MISSIELLAGASLSQMLDHQSTYDVPLDSSSTETVPIALAVPRLKAEGLYLQTWTASWMLAKLLHRLPLPPLAGATHSPLITHPPTITHPAITHPPAITPSSGLPRDIESSGESALHGSEADGSTLNGTTSNGTTSKGTIPNSSTPPFPILELGAGTGLAGLSSAAVLRASVLLTDLGQIVSGLQGNIQLNEQVLKERGVSANAAELDWKDPEKIILRKGSWSTDVVASDGGVQTGGSVQAGEGVQAGEDVQAGESAQTETILTPSTASRPHLVIATDTMYTPDHPELLSGAIETWLARTPDARAVVVYPMRTAYLDEMRTFWDRMEERGFEVAAEGREVMEEDGGRGWDDEMLNEWSIWRWRDLKEG